MSSDDDVAGFVEALCIAPSAGSPLKPAECIQVVTGRGIVGDRYYYGTGHYSGKPGWGANVTLIESEAVAAINSGHGLDFTPLALRRNIVTKRIRLERLIGREFRCGTAVLRGTKVFPPCMHLAFLVGDKSILRYLAYCGGIGAEVISDGEIRCGDEIRFSSNSSTSD